MMDEAAVLRAALRHDVLSAPIGFVLLGLGLAAGALALARRKNGDPALFYFSLFTSLYALRLLAESETFLLLYAPPELAWRKLIDTLTFVLPVPGFLFFERVIGPGWRSSIHRLWQLFAALALVAIPWEILASERDLAFGVYRWLVLAAITVHRRHPGGPEPRRRAVRGRAPPEPAGGPRRPTRRADRRGAPGPRRRMDRPERRVRGRFDVRGGGSVGLPLSGLRRQPEGNRVGDPREGRLSFQGPKRESCTQLCIERWG